MIDNLDNEQGDENEQTYEQGGTNGHTNKEGQTDT